MTVVVEQHNTRECNCINHIKVAAVDVVVRVEIAEKEGRAYPGIVGQDFRSYFLVLRDAGCCGWLNIGGKGKVEQLGAAIQ